MAIVKAANLLLRFLLELSALSALGYWGFHKGSGLLVQLVIFGAAMAGLIVSGRSALAWALGLAVVINGALMYLWGQ
jgi:hypothetical protein